MKVENHHIHNREAFLLISQKGLSQIENVLKTSFLESNKRTLEKKLKHVKGEVLANTQRKVTVCNGSCLRSEKLLNHIEHDTYDNVIIHVGTNDLRQNSTDRIAEELDEFLTYL